LVSGLLLIKLIITHPKVIIINYNSNSLRLQQKILKIGTYNVKNNDLLSINIVKITILLSIVFHTFKKGLHRASL